MEEIEFKDFNVGDLTKECEGKRGHCSECRFSIKLFLESTVKCFFKTSAPSLWPGRLKIEKM